MNHQKQRKHSVKKLGLGVLPETGFVRLPQVLSLIPVGRTSFYTGIQKGIYPKPVMLAKRTAAWRVEDIRALISELGSEA